MSLSLGNYHVGKFFTNPVNFHLVISQTDITHTKNTTELGARSNKASNFNITFLNKDSEN